MYAAQPKYHRGVLSYVPPVINRWFVRNAQNYHRGVASYVPVVSYVIYGSTRNRFEGFEKTKIWPRSST